MSNSSNTRASDISHFIDVRKTGFVVRNRNKIKYIYYLCIAALIIGLGIIILVYNEMRYMPFFSLTIGLITLILGRQIDRLQRMLQNTEFLNALFSSVLSKDCKFCFAVSKEGRIIYFNRPFQAIFPDFLAQDKRDLKALLELRSVSTEDSQKLFSMLQQNTQSTTRIQMQPSGDQAAVSFELTVEPIERPTGFMFVRGK